jgi:hypothetical protein
MLRVGFDTEFVRADQVDDEETGQALTDPVLTGNQVLCYTASIENKITGAVDDGIITLDRFKGRRRDRFTFEQLIAIVLDQALDCGLISKDDIVTRHEHQKRGPTFRIDLVAHFSRADLCGFSDWQKVKRKFDSVRGTLVTTTNPWVIPVRLRSRRVVMCSIRLFDSMLLAPAGNQSLMALGALLNVPKVEIAGERKARMDLVRDEDPELFERYAIQDAVIARLWLKRMEEFASTDLSLDKLAPTLGGMGVTMFRTMVETQEIGTDAVLGGKVKDGRYQAHPAIQDHIAFIASAFHGGRNEAFWAGPSDDRREIIDIDLAGAYTSAMAAIRMIDWPAVITTRDLTELAVIDTAITVARVRFSFPAGTRYPSLPVRAPGGRGLVYPMTGETYVTGPELVVAMGQGADIEVMHGLVAPFTGTWRPFADFSKQIASIRARYPKKSALELAAKEIGNSLYGKTAQGVDGMRGTGGGGARVFSSRTGETVTLPPSAITSPLMAAWITGMVRACCSEAIASIPERWTVYTVTTDGWLSDCTLDEVDTTGPVLSAFRRARALIAEGPILEVKHRVRQVLVVKTRGTFTMRTQDSSPPVLARAGQKTGRVFDDAKLESLDWVREYRERTYTTSYTHRSLISLRDQWKHDADLVDRLREVRLNLEFDHKRRLVDVQDRDGLLSAGSEPWTDLGEFMDTRDAFEAWRKSARSVCKTSLDWRNFRAWVQLRPHRADAATKGDRPPLVQMFLRAWTLREMRAPGSQYAKIAAIASLWWPTTAEDVRKAGRYPTIKQVTSASVPEMLFLHEIAKQFPGMDWWCLIDPFSEAANFIFWSNWDWWQVQLPTPGMLEQIMTGQPTDMDLELMEILE